MELIVDRNETMTASESDYDGVVNPFRRERWGQGMTRARREEARHRAVVARDEAVRQVQRQERRDRANRRAMVREALRQEQFGFFTVAINGIPITAAERNTIEISSDSDEAPAPAATRRRVAVIRIDSDEE